jgi:hypothetical protein
MDSLKAMNGLIAASLSVLLGQTPAASPLTEAEATRELQAAQLEELRAQVQLERIQAEAQRQQDVSRISSLEQQSQAHQAELQRQEALRQERLASLQRVQQWIATLDQLLVAGQESIDPAVDSAQRELLTALSSADETGSGEAGRLIRSAYDRLSTLTGSVAQRNPEDARYQVLSAGDELRAAWRMSLDSAPALTP